MSITVLVDELEHLVRAHDTLSAHLGARLVALGQRIQRRSHRSAGAHLETLPDTLVALVLSFLRAPEMSIASRTCRRMRILLADAVSSRAAALNLHSMASSALALHHAEVLKRVGTFEGPSTFVPPERAATLSLRHYTFVYEFALPDGEPLRILSSNCSQTMHIGCLPFAPAYDDFEAAAAFEGARPGWVFRTGEHGLGYYSEIAAPCPPSPLHIPSPSADFTDAQNTELRCILLKAWITRHHLAVRCLVHKTSTDEIQCIYNGILEAGRRNNPSLMTRFYTSDDEVSEMIRAHLSTNLFDFGTHHPFDGHVPQVVSLKCQGWVAGTEPAGPTGSSTDRPGVCLTIQRGGVFVDPEVLGPQALQELLMYYFKA